MAETEIKSINGMSICDAKARSSIPTTLASLADDPTHRTVSDTEKSTWNGKMDKTTFKTVNGQTITGSGNIEVSSGSNVTVDNVLSSTSTNPVQNKVIKAELDKKAEKNEIPTNLSSLNEDETHQTVTADEKSNWNKKASTSVATTSKNGLMSKDDKVKMDSIATGANKTVVDTELSETSTNPIQNQAVAKELAQKANQTDLGINKYQKSESDATVTLENGSWTVFPTMTSLNISMGDVDENKAFICGFQFTSGDTATSLTLNNCTLTSNSDSVETNKTYEVNILDGSAIVREI